MPQVTSPHYATWMFFSKSRKAGTREDCASIWSNYSDLTRPHPKWWFSKGNPLISGKSRLVKYYNLARSMSQQKVAVTQVWKALDLPGEPKNFIFRISAGCPAGSDRNDR